MTNLDFESQTLNNSGFIRYRNVKFFLLDFKYIFVAAYCSY